MSLLLCRQRRAARLRRLRRLLRLVAAAALALAPAAPESWGAAPEPGLSGLIAVEEGYTDNLRDDAVRRDDAFFTGLEAYATWQRKPRGWLPHRIGALARGRIYSRYTERDYAEFGPSFGYDWDRLSLTAAYRFSPDHLRVDPATTEDAFADVHHLPVELRSKFGRNKRWTAVAVFDSHWEDFDPAYRERSFFEESIEAGLRCRATQTVAPRAGVTYAVRDASGPNYDREEIGVLFGFDLYLPAEIRAIFRYEKTWRNFLVGDALDKDGRRNNNFGREDDADKFETGIDVPVPGLESASLQARYRFKDNKSTRPDRTFEDNEATLRLAYAFD